MKKQKYQTKTGVTQYRPVVREERYWTLLDEDAGFCLACGAEAYGVEPDARRYTCGACEAPKVYGLEELLIMGLVRFTGKVSA
jgi:hypothetical protein